MNPAAVTFLLTLAVAAPAHLLADHWLQSAHQVTHKADPTWTGRWACARHAVTHAMVTLPPLAALLVAFDPPVTLTGVAVGQAWTVVSHYAIDRRWTIRHAARWLGGLGLGAGDLHELGMCRPLRVWAQHPPPEPGGSVRYELVRLDREVLGTGRYALDQAAHHACLVVTALLTALL